MPTSSFSESERRTRRERIDPKLRALGWEIVPFDESRPPAECRKHAIEEFQTTNGPADYGLFVDGRLLGIVEAKKLTVGAQGVLTQAERYAQGVTDSPFNFRGLRVPFLYSTNGERVRFHDVRHPLELSRWIDGFHTPAALREFLDQDFDSACAWLAANQNWHQRLRPYPRPVLRLMPERIPAGQTIEAPVTALDVFPTVLAATGINEPEGPSLDGLNLLPHLAEPRRELPQRTLVWRYATGRDEFGYAVRNGDYKLVSSIYKDRILLFNLKADPYEQHDLAAEHPEIVERLTQEYEGWAAEMIPPRWLDPHGENVRKEEAARQESIERASRGEGSD